MIKRHTILFTIIAILSLGILPATFAADAPSSWAKDEVGKAIALDLIPADLQTRYQDSITRKEFCKLVVILGVMVDEEEVEEAQNDGCPFIDTTDIDIISAYGLGIIDGKSNDIFDPDGAILRQEAATMLTRAAKAFKMDTSAAPSGFSDDDKIALYAKEAVNYVAANGIMIGVGNNVFSPVEYYTREQAILTVLRLYNTFSYDHKIPIKVVTVENAKQLIESIAPNMKVVLKPGEYALGSAIPENVFVSWDAVFDGFELSIHNVMNLTIEGDTVGTSEIKSQYTYAFVINFVDCKNITVKGIKAGHSVEGYCEGGVIEFTGCDNAVVENALMYGCGTVGIVTNESKNITVKDSSIYQCSYSIMSVKDSENVIFTNCDFHDNKEFYQVEIISSNKVVIDNCKFTNNANLHDLWAFFEVGESSEITVKDCVFKDNKSAGGFVNNEIIKFENNTMENNEW